MAILSFVCKCCIIFSTLFGVALFLDDMSNFVSKISYYTTIVNMAVGFFYLYWARASIRGEDLENTKGFLRSRLALLVAVLTAGVVYHGMIAPGITLPNGAARLSTHLLHSVAPAAMLADYLAFARKGRWTWKDLPWALFPPIAYLLYLLIYKLCGGSFPLSPGDSSVPYLFLSVKNLGFPGVFIRCAGIAAGIATASAVLVGLDRKLAKPEPKLSKLTASLFGKEYR